MFGENHDLTPLKHLAWKNKSITDDPIGICFDQFYRPQPLEPNENNNDEKYNYIKTLIVYIFFLWGR